MFFQNLFTVSLELKLARKTQLIESIKEIKSFEFIILSIIYFRQNFGFMHNFLFKKVKMTGIDFDLLSLVLKLFITKVEFCFINNKILGKTLLNCRI